MTERTELVQADIQLVEQELSDPNAYRKSKKLTRVSKNYIINAIAQGKTCVEIAKVVGVNESTVARFADKNDLRRNRMLAAHKIAAVLPAAAENVVASVRGREPKGNVDVSVRLLDRAGVMRIGDEHEPKSEDAQGTVINIAVFDPRRADEILKQLPLPKPTV